MPRPCPFCDRSTVEDELIMETTGFFVKAGLGQIVPGYVIIFPKRHVACFAELTVPEMAEFVLIKCQLAEVIVGVYGQRPACFEHGRGGQTIGHGHIHLVPLSELRKLTMLSRIQTDFGTHSLWIDTFDELYYRLREGERYLLFEDRVFVVPSAQEVQEGYLREVLAEVVGHPEWADWRAVDPELDAKRWRETRDLLRAYLESVGIPLVSSSASA